MSAAHKIPNVERHTLAILVDNEAGVLSRVVGLFAGRGYNIESLTVAEVDHAAHTSRVTVVTSGTPEVIEQIEAQLRRLVPVHSVMNWTTGAPSVERELALVKVLRSSRDSALFDHEWKVLGELQGSASPGAGAFAARLPVPIAHGGQPIGEILA